MALRHHCGLGASKERQSQPLPRLTDPGGDAELWWSRTVGREDRRGLGRPERHCRAPFPQTSGLPPACEGLTSWCLGFFLMYSQSTDFSIVLSAGHTALSEQDRHGFSSHET